MCIFSQSVRQVSETSIFVRDLGNERHLTVYQMNAVISESTAMILPVPGTDLTFINLEHYPQFFRILCNLFPSTRLPKYSNFSRKLSLPLPVYELGLYEASWVPSLRDFWRLDTRFRLPALLWEELPDYGNFGFAVFQLKKGATDLTKQFQPMAYSYRPHNEHSLFFPTTHVHDGRVEPVSLYDHQFYFQLSERFSSVPIQWEIAPILPSNHLDKRYTELVAELQPIARFVLKKKMLPNADYLLESRPQSQVVMTTMAARCSEIDPLQDVSLTERAQFLLASLQQASSKVPKELVEMALQRLWDDFEDGWSLS